MFSLAHFFTSTDYLKYIHVHINNITHTTNNILILFGWTGAKHADLLTKQHLLSQLNVDTIISIETPIRGTLFGNKHMNFIIDALKTTLPINANIYILYYSGGGSLYHPTVCDKLNNCNIRGYIFDSSPVPFGSQVFFDWIGSKLSNPVTSFIAKTIVAVPLSLYMYTYGYNRLNDYNHHILNEPFTAKTLFITSKVDPLIPYNHIKQIVDNQPNSKLLVFEDSDHIEHDVKYPDAYLLALQEMIM